MSDNDFDNTEFDSSEFDTAIDDAWRRYRIDLADRLHDVTPTSGFAVSADPEGTAAQIRIEISATVTRRVRLTVHPFDLYRDSGRFPRQLEAMNSLGWRHQFDGDFIAEGDTQRADELAALIVVTLREVGDVLHPSMLSQPGEKPPCLAEPLIEVGQRTRSSAHLRGLVVDALEAIAGVAPDVDDLGDLHLPTLPVPTSMSIHADAPRIELWASLNDAATHPDDAAMLVARQRTSNPYVCLVARGTRIYAHLLLESTVFHRENLESALGNWNEFLRHDAQRLLVALDDAARRAPERRRVRRHGEAAA
ncbi:hypothetical protein ABLE92_25600 [Gordonia sp. VNQ95]|uniref:TY-Chap domain-containing protein n=1 Tax=Gordonia sp. VNQ95 TaxID=3156619 RepID=UPI0032B32C32